MWIDQKLFRWHCNMYIVMVAPPGIVAKSTTADIAMQLLRKVPGIKFGPDIVTWQALSVAFAESNESYKMLDPNGEDIWVPQCALTLASSEFGNLVNPADRDMIDLLVNLWDGKQGNFKKMTKGNGTDNIENPWINLIACTTPAWIAGNFPEYVIGGGFTSRCLFVYADQKDKYVAYPSQHAPVNFYTVQTALVQDLEDIATNICGAYNLTPAAFAWGEEWYKFHWQHKPDELDDDRFSGYLSRKQTHIHKTAMVLSAARHNDLVVEEADLILATDMVTDLERDMQKVFARIGRTAQSVQAERFIRFVHKRGQVSYPEAYAHVHSAFPDLRNFEGIVSGALRAGFIDRMDHKGIVYLRAKLPEINLPTEAAGSKG